MARTDGTNMRDEEAEALSYEERYRLLNPVIVARHLPKIDTEKRVANLLQSLQDGRAV